ncbi:MAG: lipocalin family protein [Candidatus Margulisiibacteriota bacterium]|jgi:lipocalin
MKTVIIKIFLFIGLIICGYFIVGFFEVKNEYVEKLPIQNIELDKYLGTWYEIARYPNDFEEDLVGVTATYSLKKDNHIEVLNQGCLKTLNGEKKRAVGDAWVPNSEKTGSLRVSFFWPFSAGYYVVAIDKDYQYALVLSDTPEYLWILSRNPVLDELTCQKLLTIAKDLGVDVSKVIRVTQGTDVK